MKFICSLLILIFSLNSISSAEEGVVLLNSKKIHLEILTDNWKPSLKFYKSKDFSSSPYIFLDKKGLLVGSKYVCHWPNKKFEKNQLSNMVLGYSDLAFLKPLGKYKYEACPKDLPVKSTWGAGGVGPAALYIEVDRLEEDVAIYKRGKINLYFPLNQIKGKYRLHKAGSISNEPGC